MRSGLWLLILALAGWAAPAFVDLEYSHADLAYVLKKLGPRLGLNIYVGPEVKGEVTISARRVPADGVLQLILKMQNDRYEARRLGNTVVIGSPERLRGVEGVKL